MPLPICFHANPFVGYLNNSKTVISPPLWQPAGREGEDDDDSGEFCSAPSRCTDMFHVPIPSLAAEGGGEVWGGVTWLSSPRPSQVELILSVFACHGIPGPPLPGLCCCKVAKNRAAVAAAHTGVGFPAWTFTHSKTKQSKAPFPAAGTQAHHGASQPQQLLVFAHWSFRVERKAQLWIIIITVGKEKTQPKISPQSRAVIGNFPQGSYSLLKRGEQQTSLWAFFVKGP